MKAVVSDTYFGAQSIIRTIEMYPECKGSVVYGTLVFVPDECLDGVSSPVLAKGVVELPIVSGPDFQRFSAFLSLVAGWVGDAGVRHTLHVLRDCLEGVSEAEPLLEAMRKLKIEPERPKNRKVCKDIVKAYREFWCKRGGTRSGRYEEGDFLAMLLRVLGVLRYAPSEGEEKSSSDERK